VEKNVQLKYRLYRRRNGNFYWQQNDSPKQGSLRTTDKREAERILNAMNEAHRAPTINLNLARAYLAAHDPVMASRNWQTVMDEMSTHGIEATQVRCARGFKSKAYDPIRRKSLIQTTAADLLGVLHANGNCVGHYLRRLHNLAIDLGWLAWPVLANEHGPKFEANKRERSLPKNMQQSSLRKKTPNAVPTTRSSTKPVPPRLTRPICEQKILIPKMES
jgi:hypothetical protein